MATKRYAPAGHLSPFRWLGDTDNHDKQTQSMTQTVTSYLRLTVAVSPGLWRTVALCYVGITGPLYCLSCLSVCNVGVLWPNERMDQDAT